MNAPTKEDPALRRYLETVVYPEREAKVPAAAATTNCRAVPVACFTDNDCRQLCNYNAVLYLATFSCNKKNICRENVNNNNPNDVVGDTCDVRHGVRQGNISSTPYFLRRQCISMNRSLYTDENVLNVQSNVCQNSPAVIDFEVGTDGAVITSTCECPAGTLKVHYLNYLPHIPHCVPANAARLMTDIVVSQA